MNAPPRTRRHPIELFWAKVDRNGPVAPHLDTPCWLWTAAKDKDGYGIFSMSLPYDGRPVKQRHVRAHRFAWELTHGAWPSGLLMHSCDTPACVNPAHLSIGTALENNRDAFAKGRRKAKGEHNIKAKLTADEARAIRTSREPAWRLALRHGVDASTIYAVRKGKTWCHLSDAEEA